jgi:hypothetical protein
MPSNFGWTLTKSATSVSERARVQSAVSAVQDLDLGLCECLFEYAHLPGRETGWALEYEDRAASVKPLDEIRRGLLARLGFILADEHESLVAVDRVIGDGDRDPGRHRSLDILVRRCHGRAPDHDAVDVARDEVVDVLGLLDRVPLAIECNQLHAKRVCRLLRAPKTSPEYRVADDRK